MPRAAFEPATPATKRPQTYASDSAATGIGKQKINSNFNILFKTTELNFRFYVLLGGNIMLKQKTF
jgi:hypothetical protein